MAVRHVVEACSEFSVILSALDMRDEQLDVSSSAWLDLNGTADRVVDFSYDDRLRSVNDPNTHASNMQFRFHWPVAHRECSSTGF